MGLIFYLSSLPQPPDTLMEVIDWGPIDKVFHLVEYTVLGLFAANTSNLRVDHCLCKCRAGWSERRMAPIIRIGAPLYRFRLDC